MAPRGAFRLGKLHHRFPFLSRLYAERDRARLERDTFRKQVDVMTSALQEPSASDRWVLTKRRGLTLLLDRTSLVDAQLFGHGEWERRQTATFFGHLPRLAHSSKPKWFLDVGAYWGLYSLLAHQTGFFDRIVAFEPDVQNRAQLHAQLLLNSVTGDIEVRAVAASDQTGIGIACQSEFSADGNRASAGIVDVADGGTISVPLDTLDNQIPVEGALLFIKMDVENHELQALAGAERLLRSNEVVLQVESFEQNREAVRAFLVSRQFREIGSIGPDFYFSNSLP